MPNPNKTCKNAGKIKTPRSIDYLKAQIDAERDKWDRFQDSGSPVAADNCMGRLNVLRQELKETHGIDY